MYITKCTVKYGGRYHLSGQPIEVKDKKDRDRMLRMGVIAAFEEPTVAVASEAPMAEAPRKSGRRGKKAQADAESPNETDEAGAEAEEAQGEGAAEAELEESEGE